MTLMLGKLRAHNERTFAHTSAHLRTRAHISKVPRSTFVCHSSARAENCKTYTFHDYEHKFRRAEKSVLLKIPASLGPPPHPMVMGLHSSAPVPLPPCGVGGVGGGGWWWWWKKLYMYVYECICMV